MIREFREQEDVEGVVEVLQTVYPDFVTTTEAFLHRERAEPERARRQRWVAELDGRLVAWATSAIHANAARNDVAWIGLTVRPDARRRGLGSELFAVAEAHVVGMGARKLMTESRDDADSRRFVTSRGFRNTHTQNISAVDPRTIDFGELPVLRAAAEANGLRLAPFSALSDSARAIYETDLETTLDIPMDEPITQMPFEEWERAHWKHPLLAADASFAVVDGDRVVSLTMMRIAGDRGLTDMTGTLREYRGRGLARLVKLASLDAAARRGVTRVTTENDRTNAPMLALNERLGFRPYSALLSWTRE